VPISRKGFVQGIACGAAGAALGALGHRQFAPEPPLQRVSTRPPEQQTYAQSGEDQIVFFILDYLRVKKKDYIDVGAWAPILNNNTYLLYTLGYRGVLIEPNGEACQKLREVRPRDTVLEAGIGVTSVRAADYYIMSKSSWNTFSKEEAERQVKVSNGTVTIRGVERKPLLDLNQVMDQHFSRAPAFLSVDTQGLELAILKSIDYTRFRPEIICAETLLTGDRAMIPEIAAFMASKGYVVRGMSFINTIFVDSKII
jgi:FkbM family methyltransferase